MQISTLAIQSQAGILALYAVIPAQADTPSFPREEVRRHSRASRYAVIPAQADTPSFPREEVRRHSRASRYAVIPAQAGIHWLLGKTWIPASAGMTSYVLNICGRLNQL
jgi:hypothetical protein